MQDPASENWKAEIRDRGKRRKVKEARQKKHYLLCDRILGKAQPWEAGPSGLDCRGSRRELAPRNSWQLRSCMCLLKFQLKIHRMGESEPCFVHKQKMKKKQSYRKQSIGIQK